MEQINYNLLLRWFVGLPLDGAVWHATVFTQRSGSPPGPGRDGERVAPPVWKGAVRALNTFNFRNGRSTSHHDTTATPRVGRRL